MVQQKESILLSRWLAKFHRTSLQWKRVRLGVAAHPEEARALSVTLRWADAIFIEDGNINIVESKLKPDLGVIGQLEGYKELFRVTPEFSAYETWPINLIILSSFLDLGLAELAARKGIKYEFWKPSDW